MHYKQTKCMYYSFVVLYENVEIVSKVPGLHTFNNTVYVFMSMFNINSTCCCEYSYYLHTF